MSRPFPGSFRSRKKLSLDGSVPGIEYNRYHGGYNRSVFEGQRLASSPQPQQMYDPDPGQMEVSDPSYNGYHWQAWQPKTPELRFEPVDQPHFPQLSLYERGAQLFAISDMQEQEMRERSFHRLESDLLDASNAGTSHEPAGLRAHHDPVDRCVIEILTNRQLMGHLGMDQETPANEPAPLERLCDVPSEPDHIANFASGFEQQMDAMDQQEQMPEPPSMPEHDRAQQIFDEQMEWLQNGYGIPGSTM